MIDFDATVKKAQSFETISDARKWVITIISELVDLKHSPGGRLTCKNLIRQIVEPFQRKGKSEFLKEIEDYIKAEEAKRQNERFDEATKDNQRENFDTNDKGIVEATLDNLVRALSNNKYLEFNYDNFTNNELFVFSEQLWHEGLPKNYIELEYPIEHKITGKKVNRWYKVSGHMAEIKLYLHNFFPAERSWFELPDAISIVTRRNQINIYQDWMDNGLPEWDCVDRSDFLYRYAGMENRDWARVIGNLIFNTMVARCYDPGFDIRGTPILEGAENIGKSWLTKSLAFDERFTTPFSFSKYTEGGYEAARQLNGQVVVELAEKGGIDSKSSDQIKAFLTQTHDVNRRMQQNDVEHVKRIVLFVVTCNETGAYLKGNTDGDTRFYPGRLNGKINVEAIKRELPQLFAQAKELWERGISPRPTDAEMEMQRKFIELRQVKPNYYYWVLDVLKLHRNTMIHEWDDGFTIDEMLSWMENETWFGNKPKTFHRTEIRKVLEPHFKIKSIVRAVPVFYQTEGGPKTIRKYRYFGSVDWNTFLDSLED